MTLGFQYHPDARQELDEAVDWYEAATPGLGGDFFDEIEAAIADACEGPRRSPLFPGIAPALGVRRRVLRRFPYSVAWIVETENIVIVAIAHARRRPGYWLDRL